MTSARDAIAGRAGIPADDLDLDDARASLLLEMAALAARESGDRRNAPLLCYLLGRAEGEVLGRAEGGDARVEQLAEAVRELTDPG
jgi:hypothetical protein